MSYRGTGVDTRTIYEYYKDLLADLEGISTDIFNADYRGDDDMVYEYSEEWKRLDDTRKSVEKKYPELLI